MNAILVNRSFRLDTQDGIEHIIYVRDEDQDSFDVETVHTFKAHEVRTERKYNKCIFEELMALGLITPV